MLVGNTICSAVENKMKNKEQIEKSQQGQVA